MVGGRLPVHKRGGIISLIKAGPGRRFSPQRKSATGKRFAGWLSQAAPRPSQRQLLERCWLEGEKPAQIARETGRSRSTVSRTLRRAQEVIDSRLKYAVLALEREKEESDYLQMVSQASQVLAASSHEGHTIGGRVQRLRMQHALTKKQLAAALSCDEAAVSRWERDVELPDTAALMRMVQLFSIRADDLLFGEEKGEQRERENAISPGRPCKYAPPARNDPHPSA